MTTIAEQTDFRKVISDRIKNEFASLIPDNTWDSLVQRTIDDFVSQKEVGTKYNPKTAPSEFSVIVKNALAELVAEKCRTHIEKWIENKSVEKITQQIEDNWEQLIIGVGQSWVRNLIAKIADEVCQSSLSMVQIPVTCPSCREVTQKLATEYSVACSHCGLNL